MVLQQHHALFGLCDALLAFVGERRGNNTHGEYAQVFTDLGQDGSATCARSTTHAGCDEGHLGIHFQDSFDLIQAFFGGLAADRRIGAGAKSLRKMWSELYLIRHLAQRDRLCIGIADNKIHSLDLLGKHVIDSIASASAYTNHLDDGGLFFGQIKMYHNRLFVHRCIFQRGN